METRLLPGDQPAKRRRPQLTPAMVETLHLAAWVLGVLDVILVALTFALK